MHVSNIDTPLGLMQVSSDDRVVYRLEFVDHTFPFIPGKTDPAKQIEMELKRYFAGKTLEFITPLLPMGSPFQMDVWEELRKIPRGETRSYADIARAVGKPSAYRAVGSANGANPIAIVIPCHRVINSNGDLGGYASGLKRKEWLLNHEKHRQVSL